MRFLLTGFAPFGRSMVNPSYEAVKQMPDMLGGHQIVQAEIPVVYDRCGAVLGELIERHQPDVVICVGQAAGRECICLEDTAVNCKGSTSPDNDGVMGNGAPVVAGGAEELHPDLPLTEMADMLTSAGIGAKISHSAGRYVCNALYYHLLCQREARPGMRGLFIHIPADASQREDFAPGTPFLPIGETVRALTLLISFLGER